MDSARLAHQLEFIIEIDRLKHVIRQNTLADASRRENSAEHSWHIALTATLLAEYSDEAVDVLKVVKMLLIHDIVEIDAGDTFAYDAAGHDDKDAREQAAADRLFGLLPEDQARELRALWDEFEALVTPEARFARAIDMFLPLLHNTQGDGRAWKHHGITREQVYARQSQMGKASTFLWEKAQTLIDAYFADVDRSST